MPLPHEKLFAAPIAPIAPPMIAAPSKHISFYNRIDRSRFPSELVYQSSFPFTLPKPSHLIA